MFIPNIQLYSNAALNNPLSLALVDGPTNRKTVRSCVVSGANFDLTIGHQPSNENPGFVTQRSVVRLAKTSVDSETGKEYTVYAQLVLGIPKDKVTAGDLNTVVAQMLCLLFTQTDPVTGADEQAQMASLNTATLAVVTRLYAGEP